MTIVSSSEPNAAEARAIGWTLVDYLYRDAGNFKAFGSVALIGMLGAEEIKRARSCFDGDGLFVAEQIGVPPLYAELYKWSGGPTASDHCWHELEDITASSSVELPPDTPQCGGAVEFLDRLLSVGAWDVSLSPHFDLDGWSEGLSGPPPGERHA